METHHRRYSPEFSKYLKHTFVGCEELPENRSYENQDIFVLSVLDGKCNGTYLEIGGGDPVQTNNTYVLEKYFNWQGISVEYNRDFAPLWQRNRSNPIIFGDAFGISYTEIMSQLQIGPIVDYLSCDIWPARATFDILRSLPHNEIKFRVITFEHEAHYSDDAKRVREESRLYLTQLGYELVVNDIGNRWGPEGQYSAEDWWIHPELVNHEIVNKLKSIELDRVIVNRAVYTNSIW